LRQQHPGVTTNKKEPWLSRGKWLSLDMAEISTEPVPPGKRGGGLHLLRAATSALAVIRKP
jgi:hypothetical protein